MTEAIQPAVEMRDVVKFYAGDKPVLNGVSFRIFKGETKIIIGASGSGKSTILKLIMGLDKPDEGHIFVDGHDVVRAGLAIRRILGYIPQAISIDGALTRA